MIASSRSSVVQAVKWFCVGLGYRPYLINFICPGVYEVWYNLDGYTGNYQIFVSTASGIVKILESETVFLNEVIA